MNVKTAIVLLLTGFLLAAGPATQPVVPGDLKVTDLSGKAVSPFDRQTQAVAFIFIGMECPVSNGYAPEMNRLVQRFAGKGVAIDVVYAGTDVTPEAAVEHHAQFKLAAPGLLDIDCRLAASLGVHGVPEVATEKPSDRMALLGAMMRHRGGRENDQ